MDVLSCGRPSSAAARGSRSLSGRLATLALDSTGPGPDRAPRPEGDPEERPEQSATTRQASPSTPTSPVPRTSTARRHPAAHRGRARCGGVSSRRLRTERPDMHRVRELIAFHRDWRNRRRRSRINHTAAPATQTTAPSDIYRRLAPAATAQVTSACLTSCRANEEAAWAAPVTAVDERLSGVVRGVRVGADGARRADRGLPAAGRAGAARSRGLRGRSPRRCAGRELAQEQSRQGGPERDHRLSRQGARPVALRGLPLSEPVLQVETHAPEPGGVRRPVQDGLAPSHARPVAAKNFGPSASNSNRQVEQVVIAASSIGRGASNRDRVP